MEQPMKFYRQHCHSIDQAVHVSITQFVVFFGNISLFFFLIICITEYVTEKSVN